MAAAIDCARQLGLAYSQVTAEDRAAFSSVGQEDWSYAWTARVASAARAFTVSLCAPASGPGRLRSANRS